MHRASVPLIQRVGLSLCLYSAWAFAAVAASAAEQPPGPNVAPPPSDLPIPTTIASGPMTIAMEGRHQPATWHANGGVTLTYETVIIAADAMDYLVSPYPGTKQGLLDRAHLQSGPTGPLPGRIRLDSTRTKLPEIGFHGLLTPESADIERLPPDPARPNEVRYQLTMHQLGDLSGLIRANLDADRPATSPTAGDWESYAGWADHAVMIISAPIINGTLGRRHLVSAVFYGQPDPGRLASIRKLATPDILHPTVKEQSGELRSDVISIVFKDDGGHTLSSGNRTEGDISVLMDAVPEHTHH